MPGLNSKTVTSAVLPFDELVCRFEIGHPLVLSVPKQLLPARVRNFTFAVSFLVIVALYGKVAHNHGFRKRATFIERRAGVGSVTFFTGIYPLCLMAFNPFVDKGVLRRRQVNLTHSS